MSIQIINRTNNFRRSAQGHFSDHAREPARDYFYMEEDEREEVEEELEAVEKEQPSVSMTKKHRDIMHSLEKLFKHKFKLEEQEFIPEAQRIFNLSSSTRRYILKPLLIRGSFLDPPVWSWGSVDYW